MDPDIASVIQSNEALDDRQTLHVQSILDATLTTIRDLDAQISQAVLSLIKLTKERRQHEEYSGTLRGALSCRRRLPPEILAEIFIQCRDNSLATDHYSFADPAEAPTLLGQISSAWRRISHSIPELWTHIDIRMRPDTTSSPGLPLRTILMRSGALPLYIDLVTSDPILVSDENDVECLWKCHERLKDVHWRLSSKFLPPHIFDSPKHLPILSALEIDTRKHVNLPRLLSLFVDAPRLTKVYLKSGSSMSGVTLSTALPWSQFTRLRMDMSLNLFETRAILVQCEMLEEGHFTCMTYRSLRLESLHRSCQLRHLHKLTLRVNLWAGPMPEQFFEAFSFPSLRHLDIESDTFAPHILPDLHHRSKFNLHYLKLHIIGMSGEDIVGFLRSNPDLETLELKCCADDDLFAAFTYSRRKGPRLSLPHLRTLAITDISHLLYGTEVVRMAMSVNRHRGGRNASFPALVKVDLTLDGSLFEAKVEARLAAACALGLVTDYGTREDEIDESPGSV